MDAYRRAGFRRVRDRYLHSPSSAVNWFYGIKKLPSPLFISVATIGSARYSCAAEKDRARLIQAGVDAYTVQKLGRWNTISMVLRYAHHQPESVCGGQRCSIDCGENVAHS